MTPEQSERLDAVVAELRGARRLFFVTGAGLSAESGLPTYRGVGGLYEDAVTEEGLEIEEVLSCHTFARRPELTWKYIAQIERTCRGARHNRAHEIIAALEGRFERVVVLTQNVDGFHRSAGSTQVIDIHGDCHDLVCLACGDRRWVEDYAELEIPPRCDCGGLIRPEVVLFGEMLPPAKLDRLWSELASGFDVYFSIGTSSLFPYIEQPILEAVSAGRPTVEINPGTTPLSHVVRHRLQLLAGIALGAIAERLDGFQLPPASRSTRRM